MSVLTFTCSCSTCAAYGTKVQLMEPLCHAFVAGFPLGAIPCPWPTQVMMRAQLFKLGLPIMRALE